MVVRYRSSLLSRVERAEFNSRQMKSNTILLIDMDENGLYGEQQFTQEELEQYIQKNGYEVVIIDDVSLIEE